MTHTVFAQCQRVAFAHVSLVSMLLLAGCSAKDKPDETGKTTVDTSAPMSPTPQPPTGQVAATWTASCYVDGRTPVCDGMLPDTFLAHPNWDDLKKARQSLNQNDGARRKVKCGGTSINCATEFVTTFVSSVSRNGDISQLPPGRAILIGAMRFRAGGKADSKYEVGDGLDDTQDRRKAYFVAYNLPTPPTGTAAFRGKVIAGWSLYTVSRSDDVTQRRTGYMFKCDHPHNDDPAGPYSAFLPCAEQPKIQELAKLTGKPFIETLQWLQQCSTSGSCTPKSRFFDSLTAQAVGIPDKEALAKLVASIKLNPNTDPYWWSCANGCCTAETELQ